MALSRLGITPSDFLQITPYELYLALEDVVDNELGKIKPVAEAIRMSTLWLVNVQLPKNKKVKNIKKIMEFPWDKDIIQRSPQTLNQMKGVMGMIAGSRGKLTQKEMWDKRRARQAKRDNFNAHLAKVELRKSERKQRKSNE